MKSNIKNSVFRQIRLGHILVRMKSTEQSNVQVDMWRVVPGKYIRMGTPTQDFTPWAKRITTGFRFKSKPPVRLSLRE